ncbi:hypothetical protein ACQ4PT_025975 [Festuca glaucescens]
MVASRGSTMVYVAVAAAVLLVLLPRPLGAVAGSTGNCTRHCGNISIPYPFGVEPGCYLDGFNLTCNRSHHQPKLFLGDGTVQVLEISIPNATVRVNSARVDILLGIKGANRTWGTGLGYAGPYFLSEDQNYLLTFGCNVLATLLEDGRLVGSCVALCPTSVAPAPTAAAHTYRNDVNPHDICSGGYCCHANLNPFSGGPPYGLQLHPIADAFSTNTGTSTCAYILHVDYRFPRPVVMDECDALPPVVPAVLHWLITGFTCDSSGSSSCLSSNSLCQQTGSHFEATGHICKCSHGYQGNPYIFDGCYGKIYTPPTT